ncbi:MAG TPA: 2-oxoacid:acceptor oxidoreductase subunit alpha [Candidatus Hydrothermia bacterium]|nr:2-oxoacid:acceptor oxidoreductase subunit alpha [Candidatus Hydrothermae bacterium]MDD3648699.1 2-oxoacid:acceptor oxidoreductase subunit alpha [Candidatus Hydrothermia bacterium]MDD5572793.1 2-oxoacid:acceptor oxidoreductase subunit alpha [Candidatus Hydrothermia bacterium]HOK22441.1 2-oxoacid:acceptor oxidoreductase subunit alpha [Candidatus Hydrothermia bacterium]HOL23148.1 2-oxoacid:acceptor oxidoreductase subunit alpha [Candidatus Hydrothermia bacterium]
MSLELLQGNEAAAIAAIKAGVRFYGGYPITPSSEIAEVMARELPKIGGIFIQFEDEISSLAACIGARLGGLKSMTATSGPGYSLMQEHVGFAAMTEIPLVIVDSMRGGPSTGAPTMPMQGDVMQARWGTHGDHPIVALAPSSVQEVFETVVRGVNISEVLRVPVIILTDEITSHMREKVNIPDAVEIAELKKVDPKDFLPYKDGEEFNVYLLPFGSGKRYHISGLFHGPDGFPTNKGELMKWKLDRFAVKMKEAAKISENSVEFYGKDDAEIYFVSYGIVARAVREVVDRLNGMGKSAAMLRPQILWPAPEASIRSIKDRARIVVVPEMNMGQYYYVVARLVGEEKVVPLNRYDCELFEIDSIVDFVLGKVST